MQKRCLDEEPTRIDVLTGHVHAIKFLFRGGVSDSGRFQDVFQGYHVTKISRHISKTYLKWREKKN